MGTIREQARRESAEKEPWIWKGGGPCTRRAGRGQARRGKTQAWPWKAHSPPYAILSPAVSLTLGSAQDQACLLHCWVSHLFSSLVSQQQPCQSLNLASPINSSPGNPGLPKTNLPLGLSLPCYLLQDKGLRDKGLTVLWPSFILLAFPLDSCGTQHARLLHPPCLSV